MRCLEEYLQLARGGDPHGTALASCSLGIMLYEQVKQWRLLTWPRRARMSSGLVNGQQCSAALAARTGSASGDPRADKLC